MNRRSVTDYVKVFTKVNENKAQIIKIKEYAKNIENIEDRINSLRVKITKYKDESKKYAEKMLQKNWQGY